MRTLAVGSSFGSSVALITALVPVCRTSSFAVVYAAKADGTATSATTDASATATVQMRRFMRFLLCSSVKVP